MRAHGWRAGLPTAMLFARAPAPRQVASVARLAPTPDIDRIARNGATFTNSFVTGSLCAPSRAAMLTGKFGNKNGFNKNGEAFDNSQPTWPHARADAGYQTAIVDKWHINRAPTDMCFGYWRVPPVVEAAR